MKLPKLVQTMMLTSGLAFCLPAVLHASDKAAETGAKISKAEATKTALAKVPGGKIKDAELETEKGKLVWSFDISKPKTADITEVQVDAKSGKIVSVTVETAQNEAAEAAKEKTKAK